MGYQITLTLQSACSEKPDGEDVDMHDPDSMLSASQEACHAEMLTTENLCSTSSPSAPAASVAQLGHQMHDQNRQEVIYKVGTYGELLDIASVFRQRHATNLISSKAEIELARTVQAVCTCLEQTR